MPSIIAIDEYEAVTINSYHRLNIKYEMLCDDIHYCVESLSHRHITITDWAHLDDECVLKCKKRSIALPQNELYQGARPQSCMCPSMTEWPIE